MPEEWSDGDVDDQDSEYEAEKECERLKPTMSRNQALIEFRFKVEQAILSEGGGSRKEIKLWGVPLLPSAGHVGTDAVLMKFLKSKHYRVEEAFTSLRKTLKWRADFRLEEGFQEITGAVCGGNLWFTAGRDKVGRPLCFCVFGEEFRKKLSYPDFEASRHDYLRWRILCVEKGIQNLRFGPGGVDSFIQILDLRNASGMVMEEVKLISRKMIRLLRDHYPGIVHKNMIINAPSWFLTLNTLNLRLIRKRSNNRFIFVKPSRITRALLKCATIENIPLQYGGLKRDNDAEFTNEDNKVLEVEVRANSTEYISIPINQAGVNAIWDLTVVGYEVTCREEFVPYDDCSYKVLLQERKLKESMRNSFYIREPGRIVITIVNGAYTKKKAFYRYKIRPFVPMHFFLNIQQQPHS